MGTLLEVVQVKDLHLGPSRIAKQLVRRGNSQQTDIADLFVSIRYKGILSLLEGPVVDSGHAHRAIPDPENLLPLDSIRFQPVILSV